MSEGRITLLLRASSEGNRAAEEELIPLVYDELRRLAASYMRRERPDHTLQPTALVHEAYLKLVGQKVDWKNRSHFFGLAAQQMRRVLVSHARRHRAAKRGGGNKVSFDDALEVAEQQPRNMIAIDDLLKSFAVDYPRQAKVVDLRFFGGNTEEEVAEILGVAPETVIRDWKFAKTWLSHEIRSGHENDAR